MPCPKSQSKLLSQPSVSLRSGSCSDVAASVVSVQGPPAHVISEIFHLGGLKNTMMLTRHFKAFHIRRETICYAEFTLEELYILKPPFVNDNNGLTNCKILEQVFLIHQDHTIHFVYFKMWSSIDIFVNFLIFIFYFIIFLCLIHLKVKLWHES